MSEMDMRDQEIDADENLPAEEQPSPDPEAPEADKVEQSTAVNETPLVSERRPDGELNANEADVLEQEQVVELDEDDYR